MNTNYNRREFIRRATFAMAGGTALVSRAQLRGSETGDDVTIWPIPGGDFLKSPDYEVALRKNGKAWKAPTYISQWKPVDKIIDHETDKKYIKLGFGEVQSSEYLPPESNPDTYAHSWTCFDFSNGPVEVEVRILRPFLGLTLPLETCEVYPSSLGIKCQVGGDGVIRFTLRKPAKIAVVPNSLLAVHKLRELETKRALEGYRNPLFLFARSPESNVPSKDAAGTLIVTPGEKYGPERFNQAKTIYFEPGVHNYSHYNPNDPNHYMNLKKGQTVYLPGGALLYGIFNSDVVKPLCDMPLVRGRGILSGDKQPWTASAASFNLVKNVRLDGIHIAEPHNHITKGLAQIKDVAVLGAWHGNTDGIGKIVTVDDPYDGWHAEDCFCMAGDSNLTIGGYARVRNHTMWQMGNAEPLWIKRANGCVADGIYIIAFNKIRERGEAINYVLKGGELHGQKIKVKNVVIDAPFIPRIISVTSSTIGGDVVFKDVVFENITVNTPFIRDKSQAGSVAGQASTFGRVVFRNLVINGKRVSDANHGDYFELLGGVSIGKELIFD